MIDSRILIKCAAQVSVQDILARLRSQDTSALDGLQELDSDGGEGAYGIINRDVPMDNPPVYYFDLLREGDPRGSRVANTLEDYLSAMDEDGSLNEDILDSIPHDAIDVDLPTRSWRDWLSGKPKPDSAYQEMPHRRY